MQSWSFAPFHNNKGAQHNNGSRPAGLPVTNVCAISFGEQRVHTCRVGAPTADCEFGWATCFLRQPRKQSANSRPALLLFSAVRDAETRTRTQPITRLQASVGASSRGRIQRWTRRCCCLTRYNEVIFFPAEWVLFPQNKLRLMGVLETRTDMYCCC